MAMPLNDPTIFWMSYSDFAKTFHRLYITRLFPENWHQLTLHSGWYGRTAGGPEHVNGRPSSTFCCNPQFKICSRDSGQLLICVSQKDPMLLHGAHVPKAKREHKFGFFVLQVSQGRQGRVWSLAGEHVVHDTGLQASREVTFSTSLPPGKSIVLIPYSHVPGADGPFVMRTFSSVSIDVTQVSACPFVRQAIGSALLGETALIVSV